MMLDTLFGPRRLQLHVPAGITPFLRRIATHPSGPSLILGLPQVRRSGMYSCKGRQCCVDEWFAGLISRIVGVWRAAERGSVLG